MKREWGSQSEVGRLRKVLVKHPVQAFRNQATIDGNWQDLNYTASVDFELACREYEFFRQMLSDHVEEVHFLPESDETGLDSIYARDSSMVTDNGVILFNMGKPQRRPEAASVGHYFKAIGVPVIGEICGEGTMEAGDMAWIDSGTLAVGISYRTNPEGIRQLRELSQGKFEVRAYPLPHWNGPAECLHLMSFISPVAEKLAVAYSRQMPVTFRNDLLDLGYRLVEVPDEEYDSMACNILALAPGLVMMIKGNPETRRRLEKEGVQVLEFSGEEICWKGAGGPTCLTRPFLRD